MEVNCSLAEKNIYIDQFRGLTMQNGQFREDAWLNLNLRLGAAE